MSDIGQQIIEATKSVAAESPDQVYEPRRCQYVADGKPSCLIGQALWNLKLIGPDLEERAANDDGVSVILHELNIQVDADEEAWLAEAQSAQDERETWGAAIDRANDYLRAETDEDYDDE